MDDLTYVLLGVFFRSKNTAAYDEINFAQGLGIEHYHISHIDKKECKEKLVKTKMIIPNQVFNNIPINYKITWLGRRTYIIETFSRITKIIGVWLPILAAVVASTAAILNYNLSKHLEERNTAIEKMLIKQDSIYKLNNDELKTLVLFRDSVRQAEKVNTTSR